MNAGKTTTLLQSSFNYNERGMNTLLYTPAVDDRYERGFITSRIGLRQEAIIFGPDFDFMAHMKAMLQQQDVSCVLVDECQFLSKAQAWQLSEIVDRLGIPVLCYGLRTDFRGEPFEGSTVLLSIADTLQEIKTICHCGRKATFNARIKRNGPLATDYDMVTEGEQILCGDEDLYRSLCRRHYKLRQLQ